MIVVKAIMQAQPGKEEELQKLLTGLISDVQMEEGTVEYSLHRAQNNPRR
jgi:quinol monooxygenase YgiN